LQYTLNSLQFFLLSFITLVILLWFTI
jgi:hypothetical protein